MVRRTRDALLLCASSPLPLLARKTVEPILIVAGRFFKQKNKLTIHFAFKNARFEWVYFREELGVEPQE